MCRCLRHCHDLFPWRIILTSFWRITRTYFLGIRRAHGGFWLKSLSGQPSLLKIFSEGFYFNQIFFLSTAVTYRPGVSNSRTQQSHCISRKRHSEPKLDEKGGKFNIYHVNLQNNRKVAIYLFFIKMNTHMRVNGMSIYYSIVNGISELVQNIRDKFSILNSVFIFSKLFLPFSLLINSIFSFYCFSWLNCNKL